MRLSYVDSKGAETTRTVHRLGIVAKGPSWYLVSNTETGQRTFRIDRVSSADPTVDPVHRPENFDLAQSWREIADEIDRKRTPLELQAVCTPDGIGKLRMILGDRLDVGGSTTDGETTWRRSATRSPSFTAETGTSPHWRVLSLSIVAYAQLEHVGAEADDPGCRWPGLTLGLETHTRYVCGPAYPP